MAEVDDGAGSAQREEDPSRLKQTSSRRNFLKILGVTGAGVVAGGAGLAAVAANGGFGGAATATPAPTPAQTLATTAAKGIPENAGKFGIMFPGLRSEPFAHPDDTVRQALLEIGKRGGIMDAMDDLTVAPERLLFDAAVNGSPTATDAYGRNPFNPTQTHGSTFFGQFITHDISFDATSVLGAPANPLLTPNQQTPALDLDGIFGGGPGSLPALYVSGDAKIKIGTGGVYETVPSTANGDGTYKTLIPDGRNVQTLTLEGFTAAYMMAYNRVLDDLSEIDLTRFSTAGGADLSNVNERHLVAKEVLLWHYHWLVVNEYLPQVAGQDVVDDVLNNGNLYYQPPRGNAFMPIEFNSASFKFGHSQSDPSFRANFSSGTGATSDPAKAPFYGLGFNAALATRFDQNNYDRDDMLGGYPAPRRYLGWQSFYDFGDGQVLHNRRINTKNASVLFTLPVPAIPGTETEATVLPQRDLLRVLTWALPPGQAVAREMGVDALTATDLEEIGSVYEPFATATPMWYYEQLEAKIATGGLSLGPVGSRIVVETLLGIMRDDARSYLNQDPDFTPFLGADLVYGPNRVTTIGGSKDYTHANLLYYAGVVEPGIYR